MAITEFGGGGGHTYTDVRVAVRGGTRPGELCAGGRRLCAGILASNADCFHSSGVVAGPRLTRVELSSTFDDYRPSLVLVPSLTPAARCQRVTVRSELAGPVVAQSTSTPARKWSAYGWAPTASRS